MLGFARLFFCVLLCSVGALGVCAQSADKQANASISGRITVEKQPLAGISVVLETGDLPGMAPPAPRRPMTAKTDADGRYRLTGIAAGNYLLAPRALAYVLPMEMMSGRAGKTVNLSDGDQIENMDFDLVKGGVIAGRITDHRDHPLIGQRVQLRRFAANGSPNLMPFSNTNYFMFETDDRGMYRLFGLSAGRYTLSIGGSGDFPSISIGPAGKYHPLTFHPEARTEKEAKVLELTAGGELTGIDIKLPKPEALYEARGRVIDASTGAPLAGLRLMYRPLRDDPLSFGAMNITPERTNAAGEFVLSGLTPGKYGAVLREAETASEYYSDSILFEVVAGDVEGLEIKATRGASISGLVVIEGTSDPAILKQVTAVRANAYLASPSATGSVPMPTFGNTQQTNPDGSFRLTGLRPGATHISAGVSGMETPLLLARIERDGVEAPDFIDIAAGEQLTGIKIVMVYGSAVVRGQVTVVNGTLSPEMQLFVSAQRIRGAWRTGGRPAQVDARGKFVLENLAPGEYEIMLTVVQRNGSSPNAPPQMVRRNVTVGASETPVTLTLDLSGKKEGQQ